MDEFCEAIADLRDDLESEINLSSNVVEVITIAHKHAMPAENLDFSCQTCHCYLQTLELQKVQMTRTMTCQLIQ